eukprot:1223202-Rhodomonas_salina.1
MNVGGAISCTLIFSLRPTRSSEQQAGSMDSMVVCLLAASARDREAVQNTEKARKEESKRTRIGVRSNAFRSTVSSSGTARSCARCT